MRATTRTRSSGPGAPPLLDSDLSAFVEYAEVGAEVARWVVDDLANSGVERVLDALVPRRVKAALPFQHPR